MASVTVLLVDDDPLVRAGLRLILSSAADIDIVGESDDGIGAVAAVRQHRPDVVLMDIRMPQLDGIAATALAYASPRCTAERIVPTPVASRVVDTTRATSGAPAATVW